MEKLDLTIFCTQAAPDWIPVNNHNKCCFKNTHIVTRVYNIFVALSFEHSIRIPPT